jgi:hypothetical protein
MSKVNKDFNKDASKMSKMTPTDASIFLFKEYISGNNFLWSDLKDLGAAVNRISNFPEPTLLITKSIVLSINKKQYNEEELISLFPWLKT